MTHQLDRLTAALADRYAIERELGSGGMATVYLAQDLKHDRRVAVKVLRPDLAANLGADRFLREVRIAANLTHPHILALYDSGEADGFLFYVMPYIAGESLRDRLEKEKELPIPDIVRILRDVVDALAHAHSSGVVHRDIKPDNIMLSGRHALVTDFGVAKAVSDATGRRDLTTAGVALGTPSYMAPEQAVADPNIDHRADIYAVGVLAYELLAGRPPFTGATPQMVLAAHVTETPEPVTKHRPSGPPALAQLVMKCLEKKAADRWQSADDLLSAIENVGTPSGGVTPTGTVALSASSADATPYGRPVRVAGLFGLASVALLGLVGFLVVQLGLPGWVFWAAVILQGVGLPIMLVTAHVERRRSVASSGAASGPDGVLDRWLTWRRALLGGAAAFVGLTVVASGYSTMRLLGIGPVGTLIARGVLEERDPIILAHLASDTNDSTMANSVTEALRIDLAQSPVVNLVEAAAVSDELRRMNRDPNAMLDASLATEVAKRRGVKALVTGQIGALGAGYVISVRLVSSAEGAELLALRETAEDDTKIIRAVDRLSARLRERVGESLRTIRANPPLEQVTTGSLDALQKYTRALQVSKQGDVTREVELLQEAVAVDTAFAMAYRRLAVALGNARAGRARANAAASKAYKHRDRLTELERYLAVAYYHSIVDVDRDKVISAYRSALEINHDNHHALNNLAVALGRRRQWEEAEELAVRAVAVDDEPPHYINAIGAKVALGKFEEAKALLQRYAEAWSSDHPSVTSLQAVLASAQRDFEASRDHLERLRETQRGLVWQSRADFGLFAVAQAQGKLNDAESHIRDYMEVSERRGLAAAYVTGAAELGLLDVRYREAPAEGLRKIEQAVERYPLSEMAAADRPYLALASVYAIADRPGRAKELLAEYEAEVDEAVTRNSASRYEALAYVALAEGRIDEALDDFRERYDRSGCPTCALFHLAGTYELAGESDSALAIYERAVLTPGLYRIYDEYATIAQTYRRLGQLYEGRGEREKAVEYYDRFVNLWTDADPELQPVVRDVRARIAQLVAERLN